MEIPYKTCWKWRLRGPFFEIGPQNTQKALPREGFRNVFSKRRKPLQNQRKKPFIKNQKCVANPLIKPVEFQDFGDPFREIAPKMIQKAWPTEGFRSAFSKRRQPLLNLSNVDVLGSPNQALWGPGPDHPDPEASTNILDRLIFLDSLMFLDRSKESASYITPKGGIYHPQG